MTTRVNPAFVGDDGKTTTNGITITQRGPPPDPPKPPSNDAASKPGLERDLWGNDIEFLLSCISMSVGLGNVWRFPFTALENGGGAFLVPYLIVLFLVGKPIYYLEMIIGQFSSRGSVKVFDLCPAMKGVGIGQTISISIVSTYYVAIMGITLKYTWDSFYSVLPWTECLESWDAVCVASAKNSTALMSNSTGLSTLTSVNNRQTSAELYFIRSTVSFPKHKTTHSHPLQLPPITIHHYHAVLTRVGIGQVFMVVLLATYYQSIVALICYYFVQSFISPLPWAHCRPEWGSNCFDSGGAINSDEQSNSTSTTTISTTTTNTEYLRYLEKATNETIMTSSELYFTKEVLKEYDTIADGIGAPNWPLVIGLFVSWVVIYLVIIRGVKSSGKASYFLAIFPYVIMIILLIRAVTLEGSAEGIIYFINPQWEKILSPKVWYAAVTQVFYSLSVCFGNIIMYSSYNKFNHNVYKDATIVTLLDTFTSLLAGFTIFGILGHLAHEIGTNDVGAVVKGGTGLAFISYPDAIAKFKAVPQIFSVLFFVMLFVLGIGSNIAMTSCTMTAIRDNFPKIPQSICALAIAVVSFIVGLLYITPGGQFMLTLVDYFGASMIALVLGIAELYVLAWVYGVDRICKDTEFMIGKNPGWYWRICWGIITPAIMTAILIYTFAAYEPLTYKDVEYPTWGYSIGWTISAIGVIQVPIWACVAIIRQPGNTIMEKVNGAFKPKPNWGPNDLTLREQYHKEMDIYKESTRNLGFVAKIKKNIFG